MKKTKIILLKFDHRVLRKVITGTRLQQKKGEKMSEREERNLIRMNIIFHPSLQDPDLLVIVSNFVIFV